MAETTNKLVALVTGANKGIGLEICRQLASKGITVILTSRDEKRGLEAIEKFSGSIPSDSVVFHRLDVTDSRSATSLAEFVKTHFGKLDILVNNAGIIGVFVDTQRLAKEGGQRNGSWSYLTTQTYDSAVECLQTNYYGAKTTTEALIPLLELSSSPRIVNVSSSLGKLQIIQSEWAKGILMDEKNLTEERIDQVIDKFFNHLKEGSLEDNEWPLAYTISKAAMNAYTRILAKKYPKFRVNSVCPGYVKTDLNYHNGTLSVEEGCETPVMAALLPDDGPSGVFFYKKEVSSF